MAEHVWSIFCRKGSIDKDTNELTLFEVRESLTFSGLLDNEILDDKPLYLPIELVLISLWIRSDIDKPENFTFRSKFLLPNKTEMQVMEENGDLSNTKFQRIICKFPSIPFVGDGLYRILIEQKVLKNKKEKWIRVANIPIELLQNKDNASKQILKSLSKKKATKKKATKKKATKKKATKKKATKKKATKKKATKKKIVRKKKL